MGNRLLRYIAIALLAVALVAAVFPLTARVQYEEPNKTVDLMIDYEEYKNLANQEGIAPADLLKQLRAAGVSGAVVLERDAKALAAVGDLLIRPGSELRSLALTAEADPALRRLIDQGKINDNYTYLLAKQPAPLNELAALYRQKLRPEQVELLAGGNGELQILEVRLHMKQFEKLGHGFDPRDFAWLREAGIRPIPRLYNFAGVTDQAVRGILAGVARLAPETRMVMFAGDQVLGNPNSVQATADELKRLGWTLTLVESAQQVGFYPQLGMEALAAALDYEIIRTCSFEGSWQTKIPPSEMIDKWLRAVEDRSNRALMLRPYIKPNPGETLLETNVNYLKDLAVALQADGFPVGTAAAAGRLTTPAWQIGLIGLGFIGSGLLWLGLVLGWNLLAGRIGLAVLALTAIGAVGTVALPAVAPNSGPKLIMLATAVFFPVLAATVPLTRWLAGGEATRRHWLTDGLVALLQAWFISLAGGILVSAAMADSRYLLHFDYFRGVKVAFALPLLLVGLSALVLPYRGQAQGLSPRRWLRASRDWLIRPVTYLYLGLGGLLLVAAAVYVARSGNTSGLPVSSLELKLRLLLEQTLVARPRTKEFLIGWPALLVAAVAASRQFKGWLLPLSIAVTTATVSVVNSFSHSFTPALISFIRSVNGLWLGALLALVTAAVAVWVIDAVRRALSSLDSADPVLPEPNKGKRHG